MTYFCSVCERIVRDSCCSIFCDCCVLWVYQNRCSGVDIKKNSKNKKTKQKLIDIELSLQESHKRDRNLH